MWSLLSTMKLILTAIICCLPLTLEQFGSRRNPHLIVDKFEGSCSDVKNLLIQFTNFRLKVSPNGEQLVDSEIIVKKNLSDGLKLKITAVKCESREAPDTCLRYATINTKRLCSIIMAPNTLMSEYFSKVHPPIRCPVQRGLYKCTNCTFDWRLIRIFPVTHAYWKVRLEIYDSKGVIIGCMSSHQAIR